MDCWERTPFLLVYTPSSVIGCIKRSWHEQRLTLLQLCLSTGQHSDIDLASQICFRIKKNKLPMGAFKYLLSRSFSMKMDDLSFWSLTTMSWKLSMNEPGQHEQIDSRWVSWQKLLHLLMPPGSRSPGKPALTHFLTATPSFQWPWDEWMLGRMYIPMYFPWEEVHFLEHYPRG